jgi:hypothetical protein
MVYENGRWFLDQEDLNMEDGALIEAADVVLPGIRMYKLMGGAPLEGGEHMSLCWVLYVLADYILKKEPMTKSRNIGLLTVNDWLGKEAGKNGKL